MLAFDCPFVPTEPAYIGVELPPRLVRGLYPGLNRPLAFASSSTSKPLHQMSAWGQLQTRRNPCYMSALQPIPEVRCRTKYGRFAAQLSSTAKRNLVLFFYRRTPCAASERAKPGFVM